MRALTQSGAELIQVNTHGVLYSSMLLYRNPREDCTVYVSVNGVIVMWLMPAQSFSLLRESCMLHAACAQPAPQLRAIRSTHYIR